SFPTRRSSDLFLTAEEFTDTLSAPHLSSVSTSSTEEIPPPTVNGIFTFLATPKTKSFNVLRPSSVADISKNTSSSAPFSAYNFASAMGSPASLNPTKLTPFTVLPFLISKQGIILLVNILLLYNFQVVLD